MLQPGQQPNPKTAADVLGQWWLPGADNKRVAGRLLMPTDGAMELELLDLLSDGRPDQTYSELVGISSDGTAVTLEGLTWIGGHDVSSLFLGERFRRETFMVETAYVGAHLPKAEDRQFSQGVVDFTDLLAWAGDSGLAERYGPDPVAVTIELVRQPPREVRVASGTIALAHGWGVTGDGLHARSIEKQVGFFVRLDHPTDLKTWLSTIVGPLRHLMTFATDRQNEIRRLELTTYRHDSSHGHHLTVRFSRSEAKEASHAERLAFLFDASSLGQDFERVLARWFEIIDEIGPIVALLFAQRYRPHVFAETRFLDAVAAAEAYHRARIRNESIPRAEHESRVAAILGATPEAHRDWLKRRLDNSNEPTLRERLKDLVSGSPFKSLVLLPAPGKLAAPIVDARNALVHDPRRRRKMSVSGRDFMRMTEQLTMLVTSYLLRDLGVDDDRVMDAVRRTRHYRLLTEVLHS